MCNPHHRLEALKDLVIQIKSERQQGIEYSGMGTEYESMIDELLEGGYSWQELKHLTNKTYNDPANPFLA